MPKKCNVEARVLATFFKPIFQQYLQRLLENLARY